MIERQHRTGDEEQQQQHAAPRASPRAVCGIVIAAVSGIAA